MLPLRGFARGKTRLAGTLDGGARGRLNRQLLRHTLKVLARWMGSLERCIVVSPCARALHYAAQRGAGALAQPRPGSGLNAAVEYALRHVVRAGARRILILPCDLPGLSGAALGALSARSAAEPRVVIAPDRARSGTNALLFNAPARVRLNFGPDSLRLHRDSARERGWSHALCECPALMFDLDTPQDLSLWRTRGGSRWGRC